MFAFILWFPAQFTSIAFQYAWPCKEMTSKPSLVYETDTRRSGSVGYPMQIYAIVKSLDLRKRTRSDVFGYTLRLIMYIFSFLFRFVLIFRSGLMVSGLCAVALILRLTSRYMLTSFVGDRLKSNSVFILPLAPAAGH